jgi:hypothetical protein
VAVPAAASPRLTLGASPLYSATPYLAGRRQLARLAATPALRPFQEKANPWAHWHGENS